MTFSVIITLLTFGSVFGFIKMFFNKKDITLANCLFAIYFFSLIGLLLAKIQSDPNSIHFWVIWIGFVIVAANGMYYAYYYNTKDTTNQ